MRELEVVNHRLDFMIKSREKHAGYEVKDLSFWRLELQLRGNRTEIWRDDCAKNWVNFINWSHMELKI